jgi:hypothetical protein
MNGRGFACASLLGVVSLWATEGGARAQPEPTPASTASAASSAGGDHPDPPKRPTRDAKRDAASFERSYLELRTAQAAHPSRVTLLRLVQVELVTGRGLDAMRHVREYQRTYGEPDDKAEIRRWFEYERTAAYQATAHLAIKAPPAMHLVVDGHDEGLVTPLGDPVDVTPGHHVVEVRGDDALHVEAEAPAGALTRLAFAVAPAPRAEAPLADPNPGVIWSEPESPTPPEPAAPAAESPAPPPAPSFWTPARSWGVAVGALGVAAGGAAVTFAVLAHQDADRASALASALGPSGCSQSAALGCADLASARSDQSRDHALNLVFVGVGAAALASAVTLVLWPSGSRAATAVVPLTWLNGGGLALRGDL